MGLRLCFIVAIMMFLVSIANAQYTLQYDPNAHILILKNSTYFELKLYPIYQIPTTTYSINRIIYNPVTNSYSKTTLGTVKVRYIAKDRVTIENVWSNETVTLDIYPSFRRDLYSRNITLNKGDKAFLPRDIDGYLGIFNITVKVSDIEFEPFILKIEGKPEKIDIDVDVGKEYDDSVVMGDNAYVKINVLGANSFYWEILGISPVPNGTIAINPNDEVWIVFNTSWLHEKYHLQPKTYTFHVMCSGSDVYKSIDVSEPLISAIIEKDKITSGSKINVTIYTNVVNTNSDLDGTRNRLYVAIVRGVYTGSVNITNDNLSLPDASSVPMFMLYETEATDVDVDEYGSMNVEYIVDAPGFANITHWTLITVVVTNISAGTSDESFYGVSYTFFKLVVPKISIYTVYKSAGEEYNTTKFLRGDKFQIRGYAELPAKSGLLTPNYIWIFVERGRELGITTNTYRLFEIEGTLEKVYIQNENGYFESSVWKISYNAPFGCYRVFAVITGDGKRPVQSNIMNVTWINITVVRSIIEVNVEEKIPPGSTLTIDGFTQTKYVYVYASDAVFENIPSNPSKAIKIRAFKSSEGGNRFKLIGFVREDADIGNYSLYFYASNSETFDPKKCLDEAVARFQIVPLEIKPENLTVIRGENDILKFYINGELRYKIKYKFRVTVGYEYFNATYPFGMVSEGEKYVCSKSFTITIPTHYNKNGLTTEMGERSIPSGKYPLKIWVYSNRTGRLMLKKTFYVNVTEPIYNISTTNTVLNGNIVVYRGDQIDIRIESNRRCYYNWVFFALESDMGLQKYGFIELVNGVKELKIPTNELKGSHFKFYLIDMMGSGNKSIMAEKYWFIPNYGYEKIVMNGISVRVYHGNSYLKAEKCDDDLIMVFDIYVIENVSLKIGNYTYWFPLTLNGSEIYVHAIYNDTTVFMDLNYNNALDENEQLIKLGKDWETFDVVSECVKLISNKPIVAFCKFNKSKQFEDLTFEYSPAKPGKEFIVPIDGYAFITATDRDCILTIVYGNSSINYSIKVGEVLKIHVGQGTILKANENISVVLANYDFEYKDNSWAVALIPVSDFGKTIWLPPKIDVDYVDYKYIKWIAYVTYENGTVKSYELKEYPQKVNTDFPASAYVFFDAFAKDFSSAVYRMKHYAFAFKVYPISSLGTDGVAFTILSASNGNVLKIDTNYDGSIDKEVVLNAGDVYNQPSKTSNGYYSIECGAFRSMYPVLVYSISIYNKNGAGGDTSAFAYQSVGKAKPVLIPTVTVTIPTIPTYTTPEIVKPTPTPIQKLPILSDIIEYISKLFNRIVKQIYKMLGWR